MFWSVLFIINLQLDSLASISVNDFHNVLLAKKVQEVIEQIEVICIVLFTIYEYTAVNKNYLWNTEEKKQKWVPADVDFVVCFWSNRRFFRWSWNRCMLRIDLCGYVISELCTTTNQPQKWQAKQKLQMCSRLFGGFSCHHWVTNTIKRDWNENAIVALISKIVTTVISSEIPMQRLKSISTKHKSSQS